MKTHLTEKYSAKLCHTGRFVIVSDTKSQHFLWLKSFSIGKSENSINDKSKLEITIWDAGTMTNPP